MIRAAPFAHGRLVRPDQFRFVGLSVLFSAGCTSSPGTAVQPSGIVAVRIECPAHPFTVTLRDSVEGQPAVLRTFNTLPLAGAITDVPEYHDCQRFRLEGKDSYGSLVGIYAAESLNTFFMSDSGARQAAEAPRVTERAVAEIIGFDGGYDPLKIQSGVNCLYLRRSWDEAGKWEARIQPVGLDVEQCLKRVDLAKSSQLSVSASSIPPYTDSDFPPVARWDWDVDREKQYIGIKCGDQWCEISEVGKKLKKSKAHNPDTMPNPRPVPGQPQPGKHGKDRVVKIKGWYDEQRLAVAASPNGPLSVGKVTGTALPHPDLVTLTSPAQFQDDWVPVASLILDGDSPFYKKKLNLSRGRNEVEFCVGGGPSCSVPDEMMPSVANCSPDSDGFVWLAKISAADGRIEYHCVTRRKHPAGNRIAATARWRWLADDETAWIRCPEGCCTLD